MPRILPFACRIALALAAITPAHADRPGADLCRTAIASTERAAGIPDRLMQAVAIMESGRRDPAGPTAAWPWTINVEGVGEIYETKQQVIAAVNAHRARGARSIDVGCMQVNLMHHATAFASLDDAFDPAINARYAAQFLQRLLLQTGSWPLAVAGYHSLTPDIGADYMRKVLAIWARPELGRPATPPQTAAPHPDTAPGAAIASLPITAPARTLTSPTTSGSATPTLVGRGLDSYRSMPTRLATSLLLRRTS